MDRILIMRHGWAPKAHGGQTDLARPLGPRGVEASRRMANLACSLQKPEAILTSPALRCKHTAMILSRACGGVPLFFWEELLPGTPAKHVIHRLDSEGKRWKTLAIVGHNPQLDVLHAKLQGHKKENFSFPKSGVTCLQRVFGTSSDPAQGAFQLRWLLDPTRERENDISSFQLGVATYTNGVLWQLENSFPALAKGKKEAVHDARTFARRLLMVEMLYPFAFAEIPGFRKLLRHFLKSSGPLRDAQVQRELFDQFPFNAEERQKAKERVKKRKKAWNKNFEKRLLPGLHSLLPALVLSVNASFLQPSERILPHLSPEVPALAIRSRVERRVRQLQQNPPATTRQWHTFRLKLKDLRYQSEMLHHATQIPHIATMTQAFKEIQDHLGNLHDVHILQEQVKKGSKPFAACQQQLTAQISWCQEHVLPALQQLLATFPLSISHLS
ncbi:MAG TPA: CHAD domain-containing protein [Thermotogota bacterium]|nr:CHAD domain-containing protein [Thermotogota bacterium]